MKKKIQNGKRSAKGKSAGDTEVSASTVADGNEEGVDETIVKHLQTVMSLIEERKVSRAEILELVRRMRQRSIAKGEKLPYPARSPNDKPG